MGQLKEIDITPIEKIIACMDSESRDASVFQKNIIRSYLDILLYKLANLLYTKKAAAQEPTNIPALLALIEEEDMAHHPISFYTERLQVNAQKLNTLCKLQLNKTVSELLQDRLMTEAKRLLAYSTLTISEIAYELNFSDNSYFNRFFKRLEGLTPEQFRTQLKVP